MMDPMKIEFSNKLSYRFHIKCTHIFLTTASLIQIKYILNLALVSYKPAIARSNSQLVTYCRCSGNYTTLNQQITAEIHYEMKRSTNNKVTYRFWHGAQTLNEGAQNKNESPGGDF